LKKFSIFTYLHIRRADILSPAPDKNKQRDCDNAERDKDYHRRIPGIRGYMLYIIQHYYISLCLKLNASYFQ
jgi:hypothetical protein